MKLSTHQKRTDRKLAALILLGLIQLPNPRAFCADKVNVFVNGKQDLGLHEVVDDQGIVTDYILGTISGSLNANIAFPVPISVKTGLSNGEPRLWNAVGNWDNPVLAFQESFALTSYIVETLAVGPPLGKIWDSYNALVSGGPTERVSDCSVTIFASETPYPTSWKLKETFGVLFKYDVVLHEGANVLLNQEAKLESLTIHFGARLLQENSQLEVVNKLTTDGVIDQLQGTVDGDWLNNSIGTGVSGNGLTVRGNFYRVFWKSCG